ncbi:hypothetical protein I6A60_10735 [Frankia sp. AgB1.9]|uniref:hypothetical protein n=1 Tax=unclassified Frankia TaxID=2632575 RepID=UPI001932849C|nr:MULTISPECIES: hypothetical protein [unclassified Frankia]MBL7490908.1 hypothetical protein [Frankia sp. AgW1.1]MBL7548348.1 hypothetical protein [Frankia sp. AgB1.9]MBL7619056.1 hypothetical protein [Frankia sp. AgB1.8]
MAVGGPVTDPSPWPPAPSPAAVPPWAGSGPASWAAPGSDEAPARVADLPPPSTWLAPPTAAVPLRPLSVSEILDGAFVTLRTNPGATLGLSFATSAVLQLVFSLVELAARDRSFWFYALLQAVLGGLRLMLVVLLAGVLAIVVAEASLGRRITVGAAARQVAPRLPGLLAITLVMTAVTLGGLVTLGALSLWLGVVYCLATPVYALEGGTVLQALRRSRSLMRGAWWRTLGVLGLAALVAGTLVLVITVPVSVFTSFGSLTNADGVPNTGGLVVQAFAGLLITMVVTPVLSGVIAILYLDRRIRREALDVTLARAAATGGGGPAGAPVTALLATPAFALTPATTSPGPRPPAPPAGPTGPPGPTTGWAPGPPPGRWS